MELSRYEQEVVIRMNAEEETAILYSSHPLWIKEMDRLVKEHPDIFRIRRQTRLGKIYELPKNLVRIGRVGDSREGSPEGEALWPS